MTVNTYKLPLYTQILDILLHFILYKTTLLRFSIKRCNNKLLAFDRSYMLLTYYMVDHQRSLRAHWVFTSIHMNKSCHRVIIVLYPMVDHLKDTF